MALEAMVFGLVGGDAGGMARPATPFGLTPQQRAVLRAWLRRATVPPRVQVRLLSVLLPGYSVTR
jgi:hypothetical protein